jgi:Leucine-rich repeat (LRR) protein
MNRYKLNVFYILLLILLCSIGKRDKKEYVLKINNYQTFYNFIRLDSVHYTRIYLDGSFANKKGARLLNLDSFYNQLLKCTQVSYLEISNNHLKTIDERILKLTTLRSLDMSVNDIDSIPYQIKNLKKLFQITLRYNKLKSFTNFCRLPNLKFFSLTNNSINQIPVEIAKLKNLRVIHLDNNNISELPCELSNFKELEITIAGNKIPKKLSPCFCKDYIVFGIIGIPHDAYIEGKDSCKNFYINPVW